MTNSLSTTTPATNQHIKISDNEVRGPKDGYDFDAKQKYREDVWDYFSNARCDEQGKVLFFPSNEGLEIPVAISNGYKQSDLVAVDDNVDVITKSKWVKEYPEIIKYHGKLSDVVPMMENDNLKFSAANLDFCNNLSQDLLCELNSFVCGDLFFKDNRCSFSLTVMNGRESTTTNTLAELLMENMSCCIGKNYDSRFFGFKNKRLTVAIANSLLRLNKVNRYISFDDDKEYMSGSVKMSYGFFGMVDAESVYEICAYSPQILQHIKSRAERLMDYWNTNNAFEYKSIPGSDLRKVLINYHIINKVASTVIGNKDSDQFSFGLWGIPRLDYSFVESISDKSFFNKFSGNFLEFIERCEVGGYKMISPIIDDIGEYSILDNSTYSRGSF